MNRRGFVSTLAASSAFVLCGCTSPATNDTSAENTVRVADTAIPSETDVDLRVEVTDDDPGTTPPRLGVEMQTSVRQTLKFGPYQPLSTPVADSETGSAKLLLVPEALDDDGTRYYVPSDEETDEYVPERRKNECWTATTSVEMVRQQAVHVDVAAGESVSGAYNVLNHPDNQECFPPGAYHVTDAVGTDDAYYDWELDVDVRDA